MLRTRLNDALKSAMASHDECATNTIRLIIAALNDRDLCAREKGRSDGLSDAEIIEMLQTMVRQRRDSIDMYERSAQLDLAERERRESTVIKSLLPQQLNEGEIDGVVTSLIGELEARGVKDMGRVMTVMRQRYGDKLDLRRASCILREHLA